MITTTMADILKKKGNKVISIDENESIQNAMELMVRHNIGGLLITTAGGICGILTERDFLSKVALTKLSITDTKVKDIASCNLVAIDPAYTVGEAMAIMTDQHCRHLPVMEKDQLVGLVSIGDLVKQASEDQQAHIHYLTDYLTGKYPG